MLEVFHKLLKILVEKMMIITLSVVQFLEDAVIGLLVKFVVAMPHLQHI